MHDFAISFQTARHRHQFLPSPREAVGSRRAKLALRGRGWGVPQQTRGQTSKLIDPPPPTPPRHAQGRAEGGEITAHDSAILRRDAPEVLREFSRLEIRGRRECRVRAAPAVPCAKLCKKNAHEHTGSAEAIRHSLRNGFTAYFALSPVSRAFLPPSPLRSLLLKNLTPASGRQDHTPSPSARKHPRLWRHSRPPHPAQRP